MINCSYIFNIRDEGARDAIKGYQSNIAKAQKQKSKGHKVRKFVFQFRELKVLI